MIRNIVINRVSPDVDEKIYEKETERLIRMVGKTELDRLFSYEFCELESTCLGFVNNYYDLQSILHNFNIIDFGCYQAVQAAYFRNHNRYIGVEPSVPVEYMLRQPNTEYYLMPGQEYIGEFVSELDLDHTFAICSAVPDRELQEMIQDMFKYYRVAYPGQETRENLPTYKEK